MVRKSTGKSVVNACTGGACGKCRAGKWLVVGLAILANNLWWPKYNDWAFVGGLLALGGLLHMMKPSCGHCE